MFHGDDKTESHGSDGKLNDKTADVVSLAAHSPVVGSSLLAELEQSWWALAEGGIPKRRDINAATLGGSISHAFIIERIAKGYARLRVAGRNISEVMGCEARGMPISALFSAGSRPLFADTLEQVFEGNIVEIPLEAMRRIAFGRVRGRMLLLPLRDDNGNVTRAVGALMFDGPVSAPPLRCVLPEKNDIRCSPFKMARVGLTSIEGGRRLPPRRTKAASVGLSLVVDNV